MNIASEPVVRSGRSGFRLAGSSTLKTGYLPFETRLHLLPRRDVRSPGPFVDVLYSPCHLRRAMLCLLNEWKKSR